MREYKKLTIVQCAAHHIEATPFSALSNISCSMADTCRRLPMLVLISRSNREIWVSLSVLQTLPYDTSVCLETSRALHSSCAETSDMDFIVYSTVWETLDDDEGRPLLDKKPKNLPLKPDSEFGNGRLKFKVPSKGMKSLVTSQNRFSLSM
ncbi:hypothetical protein NPIL_220301 [Nephila pilipes]|uniref:Uncharacterized protein n=1 Tax=Nephila pilipes TaxID=299642 RepID=A0A8X6NDJ4_NEPPI|nr:hypothetical protein NPIL_220301 [Nephila pilipes]